MATLTPGYTFTSGEVITPAKLNNLVDAATVSIIVSADLADASVTTAKISDANVTTAKIADANVTTAKIADANVTTAKLADGSVTQSKLNSSVTLVPTGAVLPFAMNSAPTGWLAANGSAVSRASYAALFAAIGTTYGSGNGDTTFNLPDLCGYFVRGAGTNNDGVASGSFGAKQADSLFTATLSQTLAQFVTNAYNVESRGSALSASTLTTNFATAETRPANIALLYCIKT